MRAFLLMALVVWPLAGWSPPPNPSNYVITRGGEVELPSNSVVQGSASFGGQQPDFILNFDDRAFDPLRAEARRIGALEIPIWEKIERLRHYLNRDVLPGGEDASYLQHLRGYTSQGADIPLSSYLSCGRGVCRENALFMHFLLREAGIDNRYVYVNAYQGSRVQNHAICVVEVDGKRWIVDAFNRNFHGYSYDQLLDPRLTPGTVLERSPIANGGTIFRRIETISHPTYWRPSSSCFASALEALTR